MNREAIDVLMQPDMVSLGPDYAPYFNVLADAALLIEAPTGHILDANAEALRTFGYSAEEIRRLCVSDLSAKRSGTDSQPAGFVDASCGVREPFEWQSRYKDGRLLWVDVHARGVRLEEQACVLALLRDITARKTMETRLRIIHEALDDCASAVLIADRWRLTLYLNTEFGLQFGYVRTQMGDIQLERLFADVQQGEQIVQTVILGGVWHGEVRMASRTKGEFPAFIRATPVLDEDYEVGYILFILNDMTQYKTLEAQVFQSQNMRAIGQLAAGIAHEINTPTQYVGDNLHFLQESFAQLLAAVDTCTAMTEAARQGNLDAAQWNDFDERMRQVDISYLREEVPSSLRESLEGISRVSEIVRAMRQFTRAGGGDRKAADLNQAILNTISMTRNEWRYVADMETKLDPNLPAVMCLPGEINQVLLNLVINAAHAIGDVVRASGDGTDQPETKGRITISTWHDDDMVEIRITDTGTGIPEEIRERVFDLFFTTKEVGKGSGQGLSICHAVVVGKHKGTLTFESSVGNGTTFVVRLPIQGESPS